MNAPRFPDRDDSFQVVEELDLQALLRSFEDHRVRDGANFDIFDLRDYRKSRVD